VYRQGPCRGRLASGQYFPIWKRFQLILGRIARNWLDIGRDHSGFQTPLRKRARRNLDLCRNCFLLKLLYANFLYRISINLTFLRERYEYWEANSAQKYFLLSRAVGGGVGGIKLGTRTIVSQGNLMRRSLWHFSSLQKRS